MEINMSFHALDIRGQLSASFFGIKNGEMT